LNISIVSLRGIEKMRRDGLSIEAIAEKTGLLVSEVYDAVEGIDADLAAAEWYRNNA
jgi:hypothetical protein